MNTAQFLARTALAGALSLSLFTSSSAFGQTRPSIAALQSEIAALKSQVATGTVPNIADYVTMDVSNPSRPTLRVAGANLQVVNGLGATETTNGLGNVLIGYDEERTSSYYLTCSLGEYSGVGASPDECTNAGGIWGFNYKIGSHNLVVGPRHDYSRYGGIVSGESNTVNGISAAAIAGSEGVAAGRYSSIMAGWRNHAAGASSSITGGKLNRVENYYDFNASMLGGVNNTAGGDSVALVGGESNYAVGPASSISGGFNNTTVGDFSSVSGGLDGYVSGSYDWMAGGLFQED